MTRFHPESGALFLHIPRTGGTSVQKFLSICGLDCVNWVNTKRESKKHAILHHIGPNRLVRVKFTFAFVRHPLTFYTSAWKWISGAGDRRAHIMDPIRWHPFQTVAGLYDPEFSVWAGRVIKEEPAWCTRLFESYIGPEGADVCSFVGRMESLASDFLHMLRLAGLEEAARLHEGRIKKERPHNGRGYAVDIPADLRQEILRVEAPIIRRFYK